MDLEARIDELWAEGRVEAAPIEETIDLLDRGELRVAEPGADGWVVNDWAKKAILLYFRLRKVEPLDVGGIRYLDKIPVKQVDPSLGVRVVPPGVARRGSFLSEGVILMPGYVNIGAWVGPRTMVDTWATVGSCAQIGADVHLAGGVGIGGVLEPPQAAPVIVEDGAFLGSRCIVTEGVRIGEGAVDVDGRRVYGWYLRGDRSVHPEERAELEPRALQGGAAAPDVIVFKDGRRVEGALERLPDGKLRLRKGPISMTLKEEEILRVEKGKGSGAVFAAKFKEGANSPSELQGLLTWCQGPERRIHLKAEAEYVALLIVAQAPARDVARKAALLPPRPLIRPSRP